MAKQEQGSLFAEDGPALGGPSFVDGVIVREVWCRSLLNRSGIGDYSFNCYTGCANGCVYCYARFMQRFHPHDEPWGQFVDVKANSEEVLARQLRRLPPGSVFTCSACDGWQEVEGRYRLTRQCCKMLIEAGFHLDILTKSELVLRDLDVFKGRDVSLGVTITTPDEAQARLWEPRAATVSARVRVLKEAKAAGLRTMVMFGPLLPMISDTAEALRELFALAGQAGADRICTDALNPRPRVWPAVQALVRRHWPQWHGHYRQVLFAPAFRTRYVAELNTRIRRVAAEAGVADRLA
jgi:DNA repair photolyase